MEVQGEFDFDSADRRSVLELWRVDEIFSEANEELLLSLYEDDRLERKPAGIHAELLAVYVSMWANTPADGGLIAVGITDDGEVTGCSDRAAELVDMERRVRFDLVRDARLEVKKVPVTTGKGKTDFVILFRVHYRHDILVETNKGEAYIRWANAKHLLTEQEKAELRRERGQRTFELDPCGLVWPGDFDEQAIAAWVAEVRKAKKIAPRSPDEEADYHVLTRHHLGKIDKGHFVPNNACALLFAKDPQVIVPGCMLRFQRIDGADLQTGTNRNVVKNVSITGTIPRIIAESLSVIEAQLRTYARLGKDGKFYTVPEYPDEAWQETIVNACVHRSYSLQGSNIFVRMFDDHFVVESPGAFPAFVTPQNIYEVHYRRNWWLMDAMFYMKFVLCENEGAKRIRRAMMEYELPEPVFEQKEVSGAIVRVTLQNNRHLRRKWVDADVVHIIGAQKASKLDDFERRIINYISDYGQINTSQAMNFLPKPRWGTAKKKLDKMVNDGLIRHITRFSRDTKGYYIMATASQSTDN